jgi:hypothetical protein
VDSRHLAEQLKSGATLRRFRRAAEADCGHSPDGFRQAIVLPQLADFVSYAEDAAANRLAEMTLWSAEEGLGPPICAVQQRWQLMW